MPGIALIGGGRIGQIHGRNLASIPSVRVTAVVDPVTAVAEELAKHLGTRVASTEDAVGDSACDAIVIASPTDSHEALIGQAAAAGKAIFCEKPIALSSEASARCLSKVRMAGIPFMVAFQRRCDPDFAALRSRLADGEIGNIEMISITSRDPAPPPVDYIRKSGGLYRDMMIHDFDMTRFLLLGDEPELVFATGACRVDPAIAEAGDIDTAMVMMRTRAGRLVQISNSRRATYGHDQRIEVHGSTGMLQAGNMLENTVCAAGPQGFQTARAQHFFLERYAAAYAIELRSFVDQLVAGGEMTPTGADGLQAQCIADAAQQSFETGQPVKVA